MADLDVQAIQERAALTLDGPGHAEWEMGGWRIAARHAADVRALLTDRAERGERIENLRAALVTVTELSPHRQRCDMPDDPECEACVTTAALAADDEAAL